MNFLERTQDIQSKVSKITTDIYGLKYRPSLEPHISDDTDYLGAPDPAPSAHFTPLNHSVLKYAYNKLTTPPKLIVEIGVNHPTCSPNGVYEASTGTLFNLKPKDCMYIGIDVVDKSDLDDSENNIFTLQNDSANYDKLYELMYAHSHEKIDFMFVDGWHSINQVIKEWKYWERMIPNGVMAFHDTNYHPGPVALLDAVDTDIFSVEWFGRGESDWGVGVVQRLKV